MPEQERERGLPLSPTERDAIRLANEVPFSVGGFWGGLGLVLGMQEEIVLRAYRENPDPQTAGRLALVQGRRSIYDALTPTVEGHPEGAILKFGVISIFTKEVAAITRGGSIDGAIRILRDSGF